MAEQSEVFKPEKNFSELRVIIIPGKLTHFSKTNH
jgi:hypothetical protein